jgi:hypothetical protein
MFDDFFERPPPEYRLSRVLTEHLGQYEWSSLRGVIAAAVDDIERYDRERHAHKHEGSPVPRLSLLRDAYESVAEAGRMIRAQRSMDGDQALERERGVNAATVIDELWLSSDAIFRRIDYERTRWDHACDT